MRGFSEQDIHSAKELLFEVSSGIAALKNIRKKNRKNTSYKKKVKGDVKDVLHLCYEADRLKRSSVEGSSRQLTVFQICSKKWIYLRCKNIAFYLQSWVI